VEVSLPERRYDLAARLLARAVETADRDGVSVGDALHETAADAGRQLGEAARQAAGPRPTRAAVVASTCRALDDWGFETRAAGSGIDLANCPFDSLAREHTELVCGMNRSLLAGVLEGAGLTMLGARLDPDPTRCCVRLTAR
jgi:predicted ArsR family transcriptional regulator